MQRWHSEVALMTRRQKFEINKHRDQTTGETFQCHCLNGIGTMRKHRPNENCGAGNCSHCDLRRYGKRLARRQARRILKAANDRVELKIVDEWW